MDTRLSYVCLPIEVHGAEITQGGVPACRGVDPAYTVRPIAGDKAGAHLSTELLIAASAGTGRPDQLGGKAAARNTEPISKTAGNSGQ